MNEERIREEALLTDEEMEKPADEACNKAEKEGICGTGDSCMDCRLREKAVAQAQLDKVLKDKRVRLEADNQDKPQNPYAEAADRGDMHAQSRCSGYYCAQDDMLKDGWVKVK